MAVMKYGSCERNENETKIDVLNAMQNMQLTFSLTVQIKYN